MYFDPYSSDDIKSCVQHALTLDKSNQYTNAGSNELTKYSWKQTLNETYDTYKKCFPNQCYCDNGDTTKTQANSNLSGLTSTCSSHGGRNCVKCNLGYKK